MRLYPSPVLAVKCFVHFSPFKQTTESLLITKLAQAAVLPGMILNCLAIHGKSRPGQVLRTPRQAAAVRMGRRRPGRRERT